MLNFLGGINCIVLHSKKKLTLIGAMHIFIKLNDRQNRSKDKTFWKGMAKIISNDISKILQTLVSILLSGFLEIYSCILVFFGVLQLSFFEFSIFFVSIFFWLLFYVFDMYFKSLYKVIAICQHFYCFSFYKS